ncbi:acetyltransferase, partial [Bacillus anthracis]
MIYNNCFHFLSSSLFILITYKYFSNFFALNYHKLIFGGNYVRNKANLTHTLESFKIVFSIKFKRNGENSMTERIFKINGIDICTE